MSKTDANIEARLGSLITFGGPFGTVTELLFEKKGLVPNYSGYLCQNLERATVTLE